MWNLISCVESGLIWGVSELAIVTNSRECASSITPFEAFWLLLAVSVAARPACSHPAGAARDALRDTRRGAGTLNAGRRASKASAPRAAEGPAPLQRRAHQRTFAAKLALPILSLGCLDVFDAVAPAVL